jgi:hypothetical protein
LPKFWIRTEGEWQVNRVVEEPSLDCSDLTQSRAKLLPNGPASHTTPNPDQSGQEKRVQKQTGKRDTYYGR